MDRIEENMGHRIVPLRATALRIALVTVSALTALPAGTAHARANAPPEHGVDPSRLRETLSRRPLKTLEGHSLSFESLAGQVIVVHFWATWCRPCQKELPALDALHAELLPKGGRVLAISIDTDANNVRRFAREHALTLPIVPDGPAGVANQLRLDALPYSVVLDRQGKVAYATTGTSKEAIARLSATARRLVEEQPWAAPASQGGSR
jgi:peroxiredoxin